MLKKDYVNKRQKNFVAVPWFLFGEALIIHGTQRAFMGVALTGEELRLKVAERYEELYGANANVIPNYEERIYMPDF